MLNSSSSGSLDAKANNNSKRPRSPGSSTGGKVPSKRARITQTKTVTTPTEGSEVAMMRLRDKALSELEAVAFAQNNGLFLGSYWFNNVTRKAVASNDIAQTGGRYEMTDIGWEITQNKTADGDKERQRPKIKGPLYFEPSLSCLKRKPVPPEPLKDINEITSGAFQNMSVSFKIAELVY
jgi:hypothetical protein